MRLRSFIHLTYHITCLMVLGVTPYHCDDCGLSHVKSLRFSCSGSHFHHLSTPPISAASPPVHFHRSAAYPFPPYLRISAASPPPPFHHIDASPPPRFVVFSTAHFYHPLCLCFSFTPTFRHISHSTHFYLHFPLFPFAIVSAIRRRLPRYTCVAVFSL